MSTTVVSAVRFGSLTGELHLRRAAAEVFAAPLRIAFRSPR